MTERLIQLGQWLKINGDAIYGTSIWPTAQSDSLTDGVWYTYKPHERKIFAFVLHEALIKTEKQEILFGSVNSQIVPILNIEQLGQEDETINWKPLENGISVELNNIWQGQWATTLVLNLLN